MKKDILLYSMGLLAALGLAYWTSMPQKSSKAEIVEWIDLEKSSISALSFSKGKLATRAEKKEGKFWVSIEKPAANIAPKVTAKKTPNADKAEAEAKPESIEMTTERFRVNEKFAELLAAFSPMEVMRVIGDYDASKAEEFGFDDAGASVISIEHSGGKFELKLGRKAFSSSKRFVLDVAKNKILLMEGRDLERLEKAKSRLYERRLFVFDWDDVTAADLSANGKTKELDHSKRNEDGVLGWSVKAEGSKNKTLFQTWFGKIGKLRVDAYLDEEKLNGLEGVKPFLDISFRMANGDNEEFRFIKLEAGEKTNYYIWTSYLGTFVSVSSSRMDTIDKDIKSMMAEK